MLKKLKLLSLVVCIGMISSSIFGQGNNCGDTEPIPLCPADTLLCIDELSDTILLSTASNLPDIEFVITDINVQATNNSGPAIIAVDEDGRFTPTALGLDTSTMLDVYPIAYDKVVIQGLLEDILHGVIAPPPFDIPCCSIGADICDNLNDAGIFNGSDFQSLAQLFPLFSSDTSELFSQADLINSLDSINMVLAGTIPAGCGGGTTLCYAYGSSCRFEVSSHVPLLTLAFPLHQTDTVIVADTIHSTAIIEENIDVIYNHTVETLLGSGFETKTNSQFTIQTLVCQ